MLKSRSRGAKSWLESERAAVSRLWGRVAQQKSQSDAWKLLSWDSHPVTQQYILRRITGDPHEHWLEFVRRRFRPDGGLKGLSLGCGFGDVERYALRIGLCASLDACDLSSEALAVAEHEATQMGVAERLHYFECDLNKDTLGSHAYDICFGSAAIHHVENLSHVFSEIRRALKPDGLLVLMEYVGPSRFQWSDTVQSLLTTLLHVLPENHRRSLRHPGVTKNTIERPSIETVTTADPSEAVRSAEILPELERQFAIEYQADFGGTLLQFLLADIVGNFKVDDPRDCALLELLTLFEETLIVRRVIPSDFVMLVASPLDTESRHSD